MITMPEQRMLMTIYDKSKRGDVSVSKRELYPLYEASRAKFYPVFQTLVDKGLVAEFHVNPSAPWSSIPSGMSAGRNLVNHPAMKDKNFRRRMLKRLEQNPGAFKDMHTGRLDHKKFDALLKVFLEVGLIWDKKSRWVILTKKGFVLASALEST